MVSGPILECGFLIPTHRDANLSDGHVHDAETWDWLTTELFNRFGGATAAPGIYQGVYRDPDTQQQIADESYKFIVAIEDSRLDEFKQLLSAACLLFQQKCIYLSVGGRVEFIQPL